MIKCHRLKLFCYSHIEKRKSFSESLSRKLTLKSKKCLVLMTRCSLVLSNMEKSLGFHECESEGLSSFGFLPLKLSPLNYYSVTVSTFQIKNTNLYEYLLKCQPTSLCSIVSICLCNQSSLAWPFSNIQFCIDLKKLR